MDSQRKEEKCARSPVSVDQSNLYSSSNIDEIDNDVSPESVMAVSRKESHRASERKRRERLSVSMNTLDTMIKQTRKFVNKKNVKLDKNSVIEHAIAYIKELQQLNDLYAKRLEESTVLIGNLQRLLNDPSHRNNLSSIVPGTPMSNYSLNPSHSIEMRNTPTPGYNPYQPYLYQQQMPEFGTYLKTSSMDENPWNSLPRPTIKIEPAARSFDLLVEAAKNAQ